jgi:putative ABC transport system permease protein
MARLVINTTFADSLVNDREICRLLPEHYLWIMAITLAVSFSASCWAGYRAARIEPAEEIRNV